jgi:WD40 repeat protein
MLSEPALLRTDNGTPSCAAINKGCAVVATSKGDIEVWHSQGYQPTVTVTSGAQPSLILQGGHRRSITSLALGSRYLLISASQDTVRRWSVAPTSAKDGAVHLPPIAPQNGVAIFDDLDDDPECVVLSPNDDMVAVAAASEVLLLETESGRLAMRLEGHTAKVGAVCFCQGLDGLRLVSAGDDRTFKVWSLTQRTLLYQSSIVSPWPFTSVAFDAHSNRLALGAADGAVRLYDTSAVNFAFLFCVNTVIAASRDTSEQDAAEAEDDYVVVISSNRTASKCPYADLPEPTLQPQFEDEVEPGSAVLGMCFGDGDGGACGQGGVLWVGTTGRLLQVSATCRPCAVICDL